VHTFGKGWKGVRLGLTGLIEHGIFFLPTSYFLSIQEEGGEKNSRKELVCVECTSSDNTHTHIPELFVPSKGQKNKPFVSAPIEVPSRPYLEDTLTQTHSISFAWQ